MTVNSLMLVGYVFKILFVVLWCKRVDLFARKMKAKFLLISLLSGPICVTTFRNGNLTVHLDEFGPPLCGEVSRKLLK